MPKVTAAVAEKRKELGDTFVNDCIKRGMKGEPGYFFAIEGGVMVGMPDRSLNAFESVYDLLQAGFPSDFYLEMRNGKIG